MAQIAQVGCHGNLNMTGGGKSRCEVTVVVQRINSGAQEADLGGLKVGGCKWLEQQLFPFSNVRGAFLQRWQEFAHSVLK